MLTLQGFNLIIQLEEAHLVQTKTIYKLLKIMVVVIIIDMREC